MNKTILVSDELCSAPRAIGTMSLSTKRVGKTSGLDRFRTSGACKVAFPRRRDAVEGIMLNTSGGLTGGDRFDVQAHAGEGSHLILTTQAAERGYRSQSGRARVRTRLSADAEAKLHWLPQEFILFDGAGIDRKLSVDLHAQAQLVLVEPIVFGRRAMRETIENAAFTDQIDIRRDGARVYWDRIDLSGPIDEILNKPAVANGCTALASVICVGPRAEAALQDVRDVLQDTGGASLVQPDILSIRILAEDSFLLRRSLVPVLKILTGADLPKSWSL